MDKNVLIKRKSRKPYIGHEQFPAWSLIIEIFVWAL